MSHPLQPPALRCALLVSLVLLTACASRPERPTPSSHRVGFDTSSLPAEERSLRDLAEFFTIIEHADTVKVYEGLPHQHWDSALHRSELQRPDLIWFDRYAFYARPLSVAEPHLSSLTRIVARRESHRTFAGYKLCGGYHPDYAIIWTAKGQTAGTLICFGCSEWKHFTPAGRLYEDIAADAYTELKAILAGYVSQRPKSPEAKAPPGAEDPFAPPAAVPTRTESSR